MGQEAKYPAATAAAGPETGEPGAREKATSRGGEPFAGQEDRYPAAAAAATRAREQSKSSNVRSKSSRFRAMNRRAGT